MRIVSWNVNGLRAVHRKGLWRPFLSLDADIYCLQEIKAEPNQLTSGDKEIDGYNSFWNPAQNKKGYSGVAIYTKTTPKNVEYGMGIKKFDEEGRLLTLYFNDFILCNIYFPNGGMGPMRLQFKLEFYDAFLKYINKLKIKQPNIIFCGDVNTAHNEIDLARPKENQNNTGFLPQERAWIDEVVSAGYTDTYRYLNPEKTTYTYWDMKTRARDRNVGWRLDYFFVSDNLLNKVLNSYIHTNIFGSDHCPISLEIAI